MIDCQLPRDLGRMLFADIAAFSGTQCAKCGQLYPLNICLLLSERFCTWAPHHLSIVAIVAIHPSLILCEIMNLVNQVSETGPQTSNIFVNETQFEQVSFSSICSPSTVDPSSLALAWGATYRIVVSEAKVTILPCQFPETMLDPTPSCPE